MGLQISRFPGPGIAISGNSSHNVIGGDRGLGDGPYGQGNLLSNNVIGVDLATDGTMLNTVTGNLIGTDLGGSDGTQSLPWIAAFQHPGRTWKQDGVSPGSCRRGDWHLSEHCH